MEISVISKKYQEIIPGNLTETDHHISATTYVTKCIFKHIPAKQLLSDELHLQDL